jgi:hypothetical protein
VQEQSCVLTAPLAGHFFSASPKRASTSCPELRYPTINP